MNISLRVADLAVAVGFVSMLGGSAFAQAPSTSNVDQLRDAYARLCRTPSTATTRTCESLQKDLLEADPAAMGVSAVDSTTFDAFVANLTRGVWFSDDPNFGYAFRFEWDAATRKFQMLQEIPGSVSGRKWKAGDGTIVSGDLTTVPQVTGFGIFPGKIEGVLKPYSVKVRIDPTQIEIGPYNVGYGVGWARVTLLAAGPDRLGFVHEHSKTGAFPQNKPQLVMLRRLEGNAFKTRYAAIWNGNVEEFRRTEAARVAKERAEKERRSAALNGLFQSAVGAAAIVAAGETAQSVPLMSQDQNLLGTLQGVSSQIQQQNAEGKARLEAMIASDQARAAEGRRQALAENNRQTAQQASPADLQVAARARTNAATAQQAGPTANRLTALPRPVNTPTASGGMPMQFFYWVGMVPNERETRNPNCVSNVVTLSETIDWKQNGAEGRAFELTEPYRSSFTAKCQMLGRLTGRAEQVYNRRDGSFQPGARSNDRSVQIP